MLACEFEKAGEFRRLDVVEIALAVDAGGHHEAVDVVHVEMRILGRDAGGQRHRLIADGAAEGGDLARIHRLAGGNAPDGPDGHPSTSLEPLVGGE